MMMQMRLIPSDENLFIKETNQELKLLESDLVELKEILQEWSTKISEDGENIDIIVKKTEDISQDVKEGTATLENVQIIAQVKRDKTIKTTLIVAGISAAIGGVICGPIGSVLGWKIGLITAGIGAGAGIGVGTILIS